MTRFDADVPTDRRRLFADAVTAHRTRGSAFLTVEVEPPAERVQFGDEGATDGADGDGETEREGEEGDGEAEEVPPWIQFAEKTFNLDCTDEEFDRLEGLLDDYPEFRIDAVDAPEDAGGTNVRISARSDANRLAEFVERAFREVYDQSEDYRAWVTQV